MTQVKEIDHASREHAFFNPSGMVRTVNCPWSDFAGAEIPDPPATAKADEGTLGHEVAEMFLEAKLEGKKFPKVDTEKYDNEMRRSARAYAEFIYSVVEEHLEKPHFWAIEKRLVVDKNRDIWGTADFVFIYKDEVGNKHVILVDYKYGTWKVEVKKNWQVAAYFWGALEEFEGTGYIEDFTAYIFQPRVAKDLKSYEPEPWVISKEDLEENYISVMSDAVDLIKGWLDAGEVPEEDEQKYTKTGSHCHFCKAKGVCNLYKQEKSGPTLSAFKRAAKKLDKKQLGDKKAIIDAGVISLDEMAFIALNSSEIKKFIDAVAQAPAYLIMKGGEVPGCKLVEANPRRSFIDDEKALIKGLKALGILNPVETIEKVITLTEAEKRVGKGKVDHLLKQQTEKSYKLVPEDSKGDAVEFGLETSSLFEAAAKRMKTKKGDN